MVSIKAKFSQSFLVVASALLPLSVAVAQDRDVLDINPVPSSDSLSHANSGIVTPLFNIERRADNKNSQGLFADETVDINLGLQIAPTKNLSFQADAWRLGVQGRQTQHSIESKSLQSALPQIYLNENPVSDFSLEQPFQAPNLESNGVDLGASYVWNTDKLGQFTLSTRASYAYDFNQKNNLPEISALIGGDTELKVSPEIQGSLTLTWQIGNHSASAVTNYFDSFKNIGELNIDEINELVDNITTFDLQYGYSLKTGKKDSAIISFDIGIRNIFDEKASSIVNQNSRVLDQNGRIAYGSIKYQF